jgi:hypothetical protein
MADLTPDEEEAARIEAVSAEVARKAAAYDEIVAAQKRAEGPPRYKAVVSLKTNADRVLMTSVSAKRVMAWIEQHCPRGQHIFLLGPDGEMKSFEYERQSGGPRGEDIDMWQEFDRDEYQAPDLNPVNTADPWADAWEGAQ